MTDPDRWRRVKDLFERARELSEADRRALLAEGCGEDVELRRELESLLATYDSDAGLLDIPAVASHVDVVISAIPDAMLGRRIGMYRITRRIGEGGMGMVYEGVREDTQPAQRVAIKLVKRGMDSDFIVRRFRHERQILKGLAHPNIGRLLDGGATDDGLPYFVMEFIDGELIDEYCRSRSLDPRACLEIMRQVCAAAEYAHQQRIIHRDIKPGNIIVDRSGVPKLLDFGIAKLLDPESRGTALHTMTGMRLITPEYASPEQKRGEAATVKSDIYALGVVLYELLSGRRPLPGDTVVPPMPNTPRELNLIVAKAIHNDPARRYQTVGEFSADLGRYLDGRPVSARPDSIVYRASRTLRKHATAAWSAALIVVAILATLLTWSLQRAHPHARRSVAVIGFRNVSGYTGAAWLSTALSEMLSAEVSNTGKVRAIPGDSIARMKSDLGLPVAGSYSIETLGRIRANLSPDYVVTGSYVATGDKPDTLVRVDIRAQDAVSGDSLLVWTDSGTYAELPAMATRAGTRLRQALGGGTSSGAAVSGRAGTAESTRLYAEGVARNNSFDPLGASVLLERAVAEDPANPRVHAALSSALAQLGYEQRATGEAKRALDLSGGLPRETKMQAQAHYYQMKRQWKDAADTWRSLWIQYPDNLDYALGIAYALVSNGQGEAARQVLARLSDSPDARVDLAFGLAAESLGDFKEELACALRGIDKARKAGARQLLAECLYYEGWSRWELGDMTAAEKAYREALQIFSETGNRRRVIDMTSGIATILLDEGKPVESARLLEGALESAREIGNRSMESVLSNNLARCWEALGQLSRAQAAYEKGAEIDRELNDRSNYASALMNAAGVITEQGKFDLARKRVQEALEIARSVGRKSTIATGLNNLAEIAYYQADLAAAQKLLDEALHGARETGRKTVLALTIKEQGDVLRALRKYDQAAARYDEAAKLAADANVPSQLSEIRVRQAQLLIEQHQLTAAETRARQALDGYRKANDVRGQAMAEAVLAIVLKGEGQLSDARELVRSARKRIAGSESFVSRREVEKAAVQIGGAPPR